MAPIERIDVPEGLTLEAYEEYLELQPTVMELRAEARTLVPQLDGRTVWMVSSTKEGGDVAEIMPRLVSLSRQLGVSCEWVVMRPSRPEFFALTKRIHNLVHGRGDPGLTAGDRQLYEAVSAECAAALAPLLRPGDVVFVHDPQPLGVGAILREQLDLRAAWRCHIGHDEETPATRAAWQFLEPYARVYDHSVFSLAEYIPPFLARRASVSAPGIDPLSHKNRMLEPQKLTGILCNARLILPRQPVLTPPFPQPVLRLRVDGGFHPADVSDEVGLLFRPFVTQVSRWDRLKGFLPLLEAFRRIKDDPSQGCGCARDQRRLEIVRLILAGPDPGGVSDDPEAHDVLGELSHAWLRLPRERQADVALLLLPMSSRKENALIVNGLQRAATIVVQASVREGFGLTATEAMWKALPVLGSNASGLRAQIRDGVDGRRVATPEDPSEVARVLREMLCDPFGSQALGRTARRRVHDQFLIFRQIARGMRMIAQLHLQRRRA